MKHTDVVFIGSALRLLRKGLTTKGIDHKVRKLASEY